MIAEKFSTTEKQALRRKLGSDAAIKDCCSKTGIRRTALARILSTGNASATAARQLRIYLYTLPVRVFIEEAA